MAAVAATGLLAVGCGNGGDDKGSGPTATVGGSSTVLGATTTTTTFVGDPYAVPEVIDVAYVNRVLAGLDQAVGDIVREVVAARSLPREAVERLQALYEGNYFQLKLDGFQADLAADFVGYQPTPGNKRTTVSELITARPDCIFARVDRDLSAVSVSPDPRLSRQWVALTALDAKRNMHFNNPTPWTYVVDGFRSDFTQPENPCAPSG